MLAGLEQQILSLLVLITILHQVVATLPANTIRRFFQQHHVSSIALLICSQQGEERQLLRELGDFSLTFSPDAVSDEPPYRGGGVLDLACPFAAPFILKFSKKRSFGTHTEWLFLDYVNSTETFQESAGIAKAKDAYLLPNSRVTLAQTDGQEVVYFDLYRVSVHRPIEVYFLSRQAFNSFQPLPQRSLHLDFKGITLSSAAAMCHPEEFKGLENYENPGVDITFKVNIPIFQTLTEQLNFSNTLLILDDYGWQTNMTFGGVTGLLQREELDLAATGMFLRADRMDVVDFFGETFELKNNLIFRQPSLSSVSNIFVLPFSTMVWVCCLALSVLTGCLLVLDGMVIGRRQAFTGPASPSDIFTTIIGCVCQQGASIVPKSGSAKTILFLFSLCTLFFYTSYSANIVALLQSTSPIIHTTADLIASPLTVGAENVGYNKVFFEEAMDGDVKELYQKKILPKGEKAYLTPQEGIRRVRTAPFAYVVESHWGYQIISETFLESEKCSLGELRLFFHSYRLSLPVINNSGYKEAFAIMNHLQRDVGLHSRIKNKWFLEKPECHSQSRGFVSVGLNDFNPALQVMCYGYLATSIVFFAELLVHYRKKLLS